MPQHDDAEVQSVLQRIAEQYGQPQSRADADVGQSILEGAREQEQQAREVGRQRRVVGAIAAPYVQERDQLREQVGQLQGQLYDSQLSADLHQQRAQLYQSQPQQQQTLSGVAAQAVAPYAPGLLGDPLVRVGVVVGGFIGAGYLIWCVGQRLLPRAVRKAA